MSWFKNPFGARDNTPQDSDESAGSAASLPAGPERFMPSGVQTGYRAVRTLFDQAPGSRRIYRTGVGVSLTSQEEADRLAGENARRNLAGALAGDKSPPDSYAYAADRLSEPLIEVISSPGGSSEAARITVNAYGALVMNAPSAMFLDVDLHPDDGYKPPKPDPAVEERAFAALRNLVSSLPDLGFRVYQTRAGFRYLCTSHAFDPASDETRTLMNSLHADAKYVTLCKVQRCFRARLTPKPWRTNQRGPSVSRTDGIPRAELERYLKRAAGFATARFVDTVGTAGALGAEFAPLIDYHDRWCQAASTKPLA
ncbi:MAG: hypothetical protein ACREJQ_01200 [bacterium]